MSVSDLDGNAAVSAALAQRQKPLASFRFVSLPAEVWSFEHATFQLEFKNLGLPDLAEAGGRKRYLGTLDLWTPEGEHVVNLIARSLPCEVPLGGKVSWDLPVWIRAFKGPFRIGLGFHRLHGDTPEEGSDTLPILSSPATIEVKPSIHEVFVELTNICNFRCTFCPQGDLLRKPQSMDFALAEKILSDLADMGHHNPVRMHLLGEPLLYPRFGDFVQKAHEYGLTLRLATNGSRFQPERIEMLFETGLDEMVVSLNTPEEQAYDEQRGTKVPYEDYIGGIEACIAAVVERGAPPLTFINVLYDLKKSESEEELARVRRIADHWIDFVKKVGGHPLPSAAEAIHLDPSTATYLELCEGLQLQWTPYHDWGGGQPKSEEHFCVFPWTQLTILVSGESAACCVDHEGEVYLGDVKTQSVAEIWEGQKLAAIREGFREGRATHELCQGCDIRHDRQKFFPS